MQVGPIRLPVVTGPRPSGAALLAIRVVMGPMLAYHGWKKIDGGMERFVSTVDRLGFPLPELLGRATVMIELVGGICLTLGLLTRLWAALATTQFLLIVAQVKWDVGVFGQPGRNGFELDLMYAVTTAARAGATVVATHVRLAPRVSDSDPHSNDLVAEVAAFLVDRAAGSTPQEPSGQAGSEAPDAERSGGRGGEKIGGQGYQG